MLSAMRNTLAAMRGREWPEGSAEDNLRIALEMVFFLRGEAADEPGPRPLTLLDVDKEVEDAHAAGRLRALEQVYTALNRLAERMHSEDLLWADAYVLVRDMLKAEAQKHWREGEPAP